VGGVKKPFEVKRRELLSGKGGLGEALVKMCTDHAAEMVRDRALSDVLAEVVAGGRCVAEYKRMTPPGRQGSQFRLYVEFRTG